MPTKNENMASAIMRRLVFIGFSVQIVMGIIKMCAGLGYVQLFGDTAYNVMVSGNLALDDYTGVLYPAVLLLIRAITSIVPIPWYLVMYVLQLVLAGFSGYFFLREINFCKEKKWMSIWGSFVFLTFPFMMQCHLAILPNSFTLSLMMLELVFTKRAWDPLSVMAVLEKSKQASGESNFGRFRLPGRALAGDIAKVCLFWFLLAINEWEYLYIGAIPVLVILVRGIWHILATRRLACLYPIATVLLFLGLIAGLNSLTQEKGLYNRPEKSFETVLFDRVVWRAKLSRELAWGDELREMVGEEILDQSMRYPGKVKTLLEPAIEDKLGVLAAHDYYMKIVREVLYLYRGELLHDMTIDLGGYVVSPIVTQYILNGGKYPSYCGRNYDIFKRNTPGITKWYFEYSIIWFEVALMIGGVFLVLQISERIKAKERLSLKKLRPGFVLLMVILGAVCAIWYMMQGSCVFDYKLSLYTTALWLAGIMGVVFVRSNQGK